MRNFIFGMVHTNQSANYTPIAVESFFKHTKLENLKLYLVDNDGNLDISCPHLKEYKNLEIIERNSPWSFSQNANFFAKKALGTKSNLFFLNNDLVFSSKWLEPFLENSDSIQVPSCNMQYKYAADDFTLEFSMPLTSYLGNEEKFNQIAKLHCARNLGLIYVHTMPYYCVNIPYRVLKTVGLFDEKYSPYGWEDTDYTVRTLKEGIPIYVNASSFILHFYGKSTWNKDGQTNTTGDKHCARIFIEKWGQELADIFGYQKEEALSSIQDINFTNSKVKLRELIKSKMH